MIIDLNVILWKNSENNMYVMCMRYSHNMHNTRKLPLVVSVNAIRMVRIVYMEMEMEIELELCVGI